MSHHVVVREETENGLETFDIFSRLHEDRIIFLDTDFNDHMSSIIAAQILQLSSKSDEPIRIYINSPGGSVSSGMVIYDAMEQVENVVETICMGSACSMGAFLLSGGTKGHRAVTPNARIMIHRVSSGAYGSIPDMEISFEESKRVNDRLHKLIAVHCGKTEKEMRRYMDRDYWMNSEEALKFGIVDKILYPKSKTAWSVK